MFYLKKINSEKFQPNEKSYFYESSYLSCIPVSHRKKTHFFSPWFISTDVLAPTTRIFPLVSNNNYATYSNSSSDCSSDCFRPFVKEEPQQPFCVSLITVNDDNFATEVSGNHFTQSRPRFNHSRLEKCSIGYFNQNRFWFKWLVPTEHDLKQTF